MLLGNVVVAPDLSCVLGEFRQQDVGGRGISFFWQVVRVVLK